MNTEAKATIATFVHGIDEPLCEAWERYNHGFEEEI